MSTRREKLSADAARRIALAASGFGAPRPGAVNAGQMQRSIERLGLLQIDSVNVLARAHYLPLFSRLGNYSQALLDRAAWGRKSQRRLFEFWAHEASLLPLDTYPLLRWRMQREAKTDGIGKGKLQVFAREKKGFIDEVRREIADRGPLAGGVAGEPVAECVEPALPVVVLGGAARVGLAGVLGVAVKVLQV